jgi:hypothetical protein
MDNHFYKHETETGRIVEICVEYESNKDETGRYISFGRTYPDSTAGKTKEVIARWWKIFGKKIRAEAENHLLVRGV